MRTHLLAALLALAPLLPAQTPGQAAPSPQKAAPDLKGTWRAYVTTQGVVTGRTDVRYVFGDLGWAIRDATGARPQDWYRALDDGKLLLRPAADALPPDAPPEAVLTATFEPDGKAFTLAMPGQTLHALRFEREETRPQLTAAAVAGRYRVEQRRLGGDERRDADFTLCLQTNGTYRLERVPPMTQPYATGRYAVRADALTLTPSAPSAGFWDNPTFFPYHGLLVHDSRHLAIRLHPLPKGE